MKLHASRLTRLGLAALPIVVACTAGQTSDSDGVGAGAEASSSSDASTSSAGGSGPTSAVSGFMSGGNSTGGGGNIICNPGGPTDDVDLDGFTPDDGDCEDCDPGRNPNAIEVPTEPGKEPFDENCDMQIDEALPPPCDTGLVIDDMDPLSAARAIEICKMSSGPDDWGLVSAAWVQADGAPPPVGHEVAFHSGHGLLADFGPNVAVRKGERMLVVSSGAARAPDDPGYRDPNGYDKLYLSGSPMGFPKESPSCPGVTTGEPHDSSGVELVIRTPSNATGFSFDFNFYTYEWPGFICDTYNDFFVALLDPIPSGQMDGNVSFDSLGNPVSVNNALMQVCGCEGNPPNDCEAGGLIFPCQLGNIQLVGTGFGFDTTQDGADHAATGWLRTTAPVEGGVEIKLRFANYDSGDGSLDSTPLIDNFQWTAKPGTMVGTNPVPQ